MFICAGDDVPSSHGARHYGVPHIDQFPCGRGPAEFPREETADNWKRSRQEFVAFHGEFEIPFGYNM